MPKISTYKELQVYQIAMESAMRIFELTKTFPVEERYSMVDQIRRSSRSVCANIAEAWRKRRYKAHFISEFADRCGYLKKSEVADLDARYNNFVGKIVRMLSSPNDWTIR